MSDNKKEYAGKDVDEAIKKACADLNVNSEQLNIEIQSTGSVGIFGLGRKEAKIRVSLKKPDELAEFAELVSLKNGRKHRLEKNRPAEKRPKKRPSAEGPAPAPAREKTQDKGAEEAPFPQEFIEQIKSDLSRLLELMGCPSEVTVEQDGSKVIGHIRGEHLETIIGPEGQTLDGLQYLLRKIVSKKSERKVMLSLDAGEFRANRMKELEEKALSLAREVKETGKTRVIPAINPAERRVVHMALQNDTAIRSRSVGDGLFKKVLIYQPGKGRKRGYRKRRSHQGKPQQ